MPIGPCFQIALRWASHTESFCYRLGNALKHIQAANDVLSNLAFESQMTVTRLADFGVIFMVEVRPEVSVT